MVDHQFGYAKLDQPGVVEILFHPRVSPSQGV
jgi:hypothetical protein